MQLSDCRLNDRQWQAYKQLELVPDSVLNPSASAPDFRFGLDRLWRSLISLLADELVDREQQVEYLERCWKSDIGDEDSSASRLHQLWTLMN